MAKKTNIVKKAKGNLNLLLILLLVICVLCALMILTSNDAEKEQNALIEEAQEFLEEKLYIRAVENYLVALDDYDTKRNPELETELLAIYKEAGMMGDYYSMIEDRIDDKVASEEEVIALYNMHVESGSYRNAIKVINDSLIYIESKELQRLKEEICYEYRDRDVNLTEMVQPASDWLIPTFDGNKWGYVFSDGNLMLANIYDDATRFCEGYAVVKLDGVYTRIDENGYWCAVDKDSLDDVTDISAQAIVGVKDNQYYLYSLDFELLTKESFDCVYLSDNGVYCVQKGGKWALLDEDLEQITEYEFTDVVLNSRGQVFTGKYAVVKDESGYYFIKSNGNAVTDVRFTEAKGYEGGLIAVADSGGKWGFADIDGNMVIDYQYTDAYSFSSGLGAINDAGEWGYVNQFNKIVIEANFQEAYPFVGKSALVKNEMGIYQILTLRFYDYL